MSLFIPTCCRYLPEDGILPLHCCYTFSGGIRMRAMASAILLFMLNLIGPGWARGNETERLVSAPVGVDALRYAMSITVMVNCWCAFHYFTAAKTIRKISREPLTEITRSQRAASACSTLLTPITSRPSIRDLGTLAFGTIARLKPCLAASCRRSVHLAQADFASSASPKQSSGDQ